MTWKMRLADLVCCIAFAAVIWPLEGFRYVLAIMLLIVYATIHKALK